MQRNRISIIAIASSALATFTIGVVGSARGADRSLSVGPHASRSPSSPSAAPALPEVMTLDKAIKRAIANNRALQSQRLNLRLAEIGYDSAWDNMFLPNVTLNLTSNSTRTIGHLPGDVATAAGDANDNHGYPTTGAVLSLGSYTIFNSWRDWIGYQSAQLDWVRTKEVFSEGIRALRFQVILAFYGLKIEHEKLDAAKRSVEISEAITALVKSRVRTGKATESDLQSSTVDLLTSKNELGNRLTAANSALGALNQLLGDALDSPYTIQGELQYVPLKVTSEQAQKAYLEQSPTMKNFKKDLKKADMNVESAELNRIPLPKVSFSGINIGYNNAYYASARDYNTGSGSNVGIDVSAQINLSIPILGSSGFFGSRTVEQARIARNVTELSYQDAGSHESVTVGQLVFTIQRDEDAIQNNKKSFENSANLLEGLVGKLSSGQTTRLELRDAILQARNGELTLLDSNLTHLSHKLALAQLIGMDHLPGDLY